MLLQDDTSVALLKFNTGVAAASITAAVLTLHVKAAGAGFNQFLVVGVQGAHSHIIFSTSFFPHFSTSTSDAC